VRNPTGRAISGWHADDALWFPLPEEVPRFDPRCTFPALLINGQLPLTDIPTVAHGPTQVVPGSHYSGRTPPPGEESPTWEGRGVHSILCDAGDFYLQHPQVWHRGAPNTSTTTRYLLQHAYGRRFIAQRFYPFLNYRMPPHVLADASPRLLRVLGLHPKGAYG
jgi:ectoine hydroxylase-related dioxygenase (phytanoyl-CoA dioxygenase family)